MRAIFFSVLAGLLLTAPFPSDAATAPVQTTLPVVFEANLGQAGPEVRFIGRGPGWTALLGDRTVSLVRGEQAWTVEFERAADGVLVRGEGRLSSRSGYFFGPSAEDWITDVPHFERVGYSHLYSGIDAVFYDRGGLLEYDLLLSPGADAGQIALRFSGAEPMRVDPNGDLVFKTRSGEVRKTRPRAYQSLDGREVEVRADYELRADGSIGFDLGPYDRSEPLVVDPLIYSTFFGGSNSVGQTGIGVDQQGTLYLSGESGGVDFPTTVPPQANFTNSRFVAKIDLTQSGTAALLYSAFIGISSNLTEFGPDGRVYLAGRATNFSPGPTENAVQQQGNGSGEVYLLILDLSRPASETVVYASYLGGSGSDDIEQMRLAPGGRLVLTGRTSSNDFPLTANAFDRVCASTGCADRTSGRWIAVVDPALPGSAGLILSSFVDLESPLMAVDNLGRVHMAAQFAPDSFTPTGNAFQPICRLSEFDTCNDLYYVAIDPSRPDPGSRFYATFIGGGGRESPRGLSVDPQNRAWLAGDTRSLDFPSSNALFSAGCPEFRPDCTELSSEDAFVIGIDPNQAGEASRVFSARFGGAGGDIAEGVVASTNGWIVVAGTSRSEDFPTTESAYSQDCQYDIPDRDCSSPDLFFLQLDPTAPGEQALRYSTLVGGGNTDTLPHLMHPAGAIAEHEGRIVAIAETRSRDFPLSDDAIDAVQPLGSLSSGRQVILEIDPGQTGPASLSYSSFLWTGEQPTRTAIESARYVNGRLYLSGGTNQPDFPTTVNATDRTCGFGQVLPDGTCPYNAFVAVIDPSPGVTLEVSPSLVELEYMAPDPGLDGVAIQVTTNDPGLTLQLSADSDLDWLQVEPAQLTGGGTIVVNADVTHLEGPGTRQGRVIVSSQDPPLRRAIYFNVTIDVRPPGAIGAIVNAASFEETSIAPGEIISIFGTNLGTLGGRSAEIEERGNIVTLFGSRVMFNGVESPALFARHDQINAVVPPSVAGERLVTVAVRNERGQSPGFGVTVAPSAPALFTVTGTGRGQGAILNQDGSLNSLENPAQPGSIVVLYGTGAGLTDPPASPWSLASAPLPELTLTVTVTIGGQTAEVLFAGPAPGFTGLLQVNARVPNIQPGDAAPVRVQIGGAMSPEQVTLAVR